MALVLSHSFNLCNAVPRHKFCDGYVRANDSSNEIPIHRIILAAASKRLSIIFDTQSNDDSKYEVPDVISFDTLAKTIDLIYTGEVALESDDEYAKLCVALVVLKIDIGKVVIKRIEQEKDENECAENIKQIEFPRTDSNSISTPLQSKLTVHVDVNNCTIIKGMKRKYEETGTHVASINSNKKDVAEENLFEEYKTGLKSVIRSAIKMPETRTDNPSHKHEISSSQPEICSELSQFLHSNSREQLKSSTNLPEAGGIKSNFVPVATPQSHVKSRSHAGFTRDMVKCRCHEFLLSLLQIASSRSASADRSMRLLVQGLIDGQIEPDTFLVKLQMKNMQHVAPFLRLSLPYLQYSLARRELSIPGTVPPLHMISQLGYLPPDLILGTSGPPICVPSIKSQHVTQATQTSPSINRPVMTSGSENIASHDIDKQLELERMHQPTPLIGPIRIHPAGSTPVVPISSTSHSPPRSVTPAGRVATRTPSRSSLLVSSIVTPNPMLTPVRSKLLGQRPPVKSPQTQVPIRAPLSGTQQASVTVRTKRGLSTRYIPFKYPVPPRSVLSPVTLNPPAPQYSASAHVRYNHPAPQYRYILPVPQHQHAISVSVNLPWEPTLAPQAQPTLWETSEDSNNAHKIFQSYEFSDRIQPIKTNDVNNNIRGKKRRSGQ